MTPQAIRRAKTQQPRQKPRKASKPEATTRMPSSTAGPTAEPVVSHSTAARPLTTVPMPWANRLGGPGTSRGLPSRGATTWTASRPSGLYRGPQPSRSANPTKSTSVIQCQPVARASTESEKTPKATERAAHSFTGFGKWNRLRRGVFTSPTREVFIRGFLLDPRSPAPAGRGPGT